MKYIVVHSGARDLYKVAETLYANDKLGYLVTDDILLRKQYRRLLPYKKIKISFCGLFFCLLCHIFPKGKFNINKDYFLGRKAGKLSQKHKMPLLAYSQYAFSAFNNSNIHPRILFQFHPHSISIKRIYDKEIIKNPQCKENFLTENEYKLSQKQLNKLLKEVQLADYAIVASSYTKDTLIENGFKEDKIVIAPYGVNLNDYPAKKKYREVNNELNLVFVGNYTHRKGIHYLLSAVKMIQDEGYKLHLSMTGRGPLDKRQLYSYGVKNLDLYYNLSHDNLISLLHNSDIFIFPSLVEGYGFVIIEAMATGLPVIVSSRTCGRDLVKNGDEGFVIEPGDINSIIQSIKYFYENPNMIEFMGRRANILAHQNSWINFSNKILESIKLAESSIIK